MRKQIEESLVGLVGVRLDPKGSGKYEADLCIAGLGRVSLGLYDSASEAGIAHDNAKMLAATKGLTAKPPLRQRYNHPGRAKRMVETGALPAIPAALEKLTNRVSAQLTKTIGVPAPKLNRVATAVQTLEGTLKSLEARLAALEARL